MRRRAGMATAIAVLVLAGCAATPPDAAPELPAFPVGAPIDYQLGGISPVPEGVGIVVRDVTAEPADGVFSICYLNGFQTQPGDDRWDAHPQLLLRDDAGQAIADPNWPDEFLLDTASPEHRSAIADLLELQIRSCAQKGFAAVEFDNLDSFTRADGVTREGNIALAAPLVAAAHEVGLLAGQKNTGEFSRQLRDEVGFDFAIAEECVAYGECGLYRAVYGEAVIAIEYADSAGADVAAVCADPERPRSLVIRDRGLVPAGSPGYVFAAC